MRKLFWGIVCLAICIQLAGCQGWLVRSSTSTKVRVDQQVAGNRGFLSGKPVAPPKEPTFKERKVYRVEVELPDITKKAAPATRPASKDRAIQGNKGYLIGAAPKKKQEPKRTVIDEIKEPIVAAKEKIVEIFKSKPPTPAAAPAAAPKPSIVVTPQTYRTRKGDTLQKISQRFYGTTKKWPLLYRANKDKIKNPDKILPGQVLVIPGLDQIKK